MLKPTSSGSIGTLDELNRTKRNPQTNTQFDYNTSKIGGATTGTMSNIFDIINNIGSASCNINPNQPACQNNQFQRNTEQIRQATIGTTGGVFQSVKTIGGASCEIDPYQPACRNINQ